MIIGLAGAKTSGKNTAAKYIFEEFGQYQVTEWSFAAKLKQSAVASLIGKVVSEEDAIECCDMLKESAEFHIKTDLPDVPNTKVIWQKLTGREFLQWYGTEAHREIFGEDFWVDAVMKQIPTPVVTIGSKRDWNSRLDIITDVRFPNEAAAILEYGGRVIRIHRMASIYDDNHASEKPLPNNLVWAEVDNNGTKEELRNEIRPHVEYAIEQMYIG